MAELSVTAELERYGPRARRAARVSRAEALAYCRDLARRHYENFTVGSLLLPRHLLPHFFAIYAYCRWADDLADETADPRRGAELLDWWQEQLERCYAGAPEHPVFVALLPTIEEFSIPREPFDRLLTAFRQDQSVTRYDAHEDVLGYCRNSADPVGRLILYVGRCHDEARGKLSDAICTGLQLANFCQDVARDWDQDRIYLPRATLAGAGCSPDAFAARRATPEFRAALRREVDRAEAYLRAGEPLVRMMPRELRLEVALFAAGGLSILRAIRDLEYDVWTRRPTVSRGRKGSLLLRCWWQTRRMGA